MNPALFRGALWLAALAAGAAALATEGHSTWLAAAAVAAGSFAWWAWRSARARQAWPRTDAVSLLPAPLQLDGAALDDVAARIRQLGSGARSLDAALHEAARILKSELGAVEARVYRVQPALSGMHGRPRITELIATRGGLRPMGEVSANDGSALVIAIRRQLAVLSLPDAVTLPIVCADTVVAALALGDIAIAVDLDALDGLLTATNDTLAEIAGRSATVLAPLRSSHSESRGADESQFHRSGFDGSPTPHPLRHGPLPTMLTRRSPPHTPAADPAANLAAGAITTSVGAPTGSDNPTTVGVLDAAALARLAELDPAGTSRLLPRVLTAYLTSVARLHPQLVAARPTRDFEAIRHVTHTLKSSSASIGAIKLAAICAEIDSMIRTADTAGIDTHLDSMDAELERVLKAVKHLLGGHP